MLQELYNETVREYLPRKFGVLNGVSVRSFRLFDMTDREPEYEQALVNALREKIRVGDSVVIVGGGQGVSTVASAQCRPESITTIEATAERIERLQETLEHNWTPSDISVLHGVVGDEVSLKGERGSPVMVSPDELHECDVLELDCEGAELGILRNMTIRPRCIIVETHGCFGSPESAVRQELDSLGYDVVERGVEVASKGVFVLTAVRE